jgi:hypothetical protein
VSGILRRPLLLEAVALCGLACAGVATSWVASRAVTRVLIKLGPNDGDYVSGFRTEWERDGYTRFRWTGLKAALRAPVRLTGDAFRLRMRVRRHFEDPARVRLATEGRVFAAFDLQADRRVAYRVFEFPLPRLAGAQPFEIDIDSRPTEARPLGMAMDWVEIERTGSSGRVHLAAVAVARIVGLALLVYLTLRLAGSGRRLALASGAFLLVAVGVGTAVDVVAAERIVRLGWPLVAGVGLITIVAVRSGPGRRALGLDSPLVGGVLALLVLAAVAVRLVIVLHPQFFYPDVRIHGLVLWRLDRLGLAEFLRQFHEIQFRFSLGLQFVKERWYAMPYPPALYVLAWPLARFMGYAYETAVSVLPAALNALEVLLVFAVGRRLRLSAAAAAAGGGVLALLPLFLIRLSLGYFPAIVGHFFDALFILLVIVFLGRLGRPRVVLILGLVLGATLLTYTQSLLNFGILLPLFVIVELLVDRTPGRWARAWGLAAAGALGVLLSITLFYVRYVPAVRSMSRGEPMRGVEIKDELDRQRAQYAATALPDEDDPDAGPGLNPWRGVRKAARRMWVFYGAFAPLVLVGIVLIVARLEGSLLRFVVVWASVYLALNLASGGLPGPNLVRYNKDLEIVAPLFCLALGRLWEWLWLRGRVFGSLAGAAYLLYGLWRASAALVARFFMER